MCYIVDNFDFVLLVLVLFLWLTIVYRFLIISKMISQLINILGSISQADRSNLPIFPIILSLSCFLSQLADMF